MKGPVLEHEPTKIDSSLVDEKEYVKNLSEFIFNMNDWMKENVVTVIKLSKPFLTYEESKELTNIFMTRFLKYISSRKMEMSNILYKANKGEITISEAEKRIKDIRIDMSKNIIQNFVDLDILTREKADMILNRIDELIAPGAVIGGTGIAALSVGLKIKAVATGLIATVSGWGLIVLGALAITGVTIVIIKDESYDRIRAANALRSISPKSFESFNQAWEKVFGQPFDPALQKELREQWKQLRLEKVPHPQVPR